MFLSRVVVVGACEVSKLLINKKLNDKIEKKKQSRKGKKKLELTKLIL
jgi:hypothetical protein